MQAKIVKLAYKPEPKTDAEIRERRALLKAQAAYLMAKYEQKKAA